MCYFHNCWIEAGVHMSRWPKRENKKKISEMTTKTAPSNFINQISSIFIQQKQMSGCPILGICDYKAKDEKT